jgi:hypothetical protein
MVIACLAAAWSLGSTWWSSREMELLRQQLQRSQVRWDEARSASLEALDIVDAYFSTVEWKSGDKVMVPQGKTEVSIQRVRRCYNRLALSVTDPQVLRLFRRALQMGSPTSGPVPLDAGAISELRNAIRKELFGAPPLVDDPDAGWVLRMRGVCDENDPGCASGAKP